MATPTALAAAATVFGPVPDREYHEAFMRKAIEMAELALLSDETPVGCVFVHKGTVIGRGINGTNASLNVRRTFPSPKTVPFAPHSSCAPQSGEPEQRHGEKTGGVIELGQFFIRMADAAS
nr:trna-specific adenosine deaminase subunit tad2 [Quercus suber]